MRKSSLLSDCSRSMEKWKSLTRFAIPNWRIVGTSLALWAREPLERSSRQLISRKQHKVSLDQSSLNLLEIMI